MSQIIKIWVDILCSECYEPITLGMDSDEYDKKIRKYDDTEYCKKCDDFVFPIVVMKREYDIRLAPATGCQRIERDINHGVEILHIDGAGITTNLEPYPTGAKNKTIYCDFSNENPPR